MSAPFPPPSVPIAVLVNARAALLLAQSTAQSAEPLTVEQMLYVARAHGELGFWVDRLLADHTATVKA